MSDHRRNCPRYGTDALTFWELQACDACTCQPAPQKEDLAVCPKCLYAGKLCTCAREKRESAESGTPESAPVRHTWRPVDLAAVLDGTWQPPVPTVGRRDDGIGLFYPGRVHTIAAESEAGKTWLALHAVVAELAAGNAALYLDFEDDEGGVVGRLLSLGAKPDQIRDRFAYLRPEDPVTAPEARPDLGQALADLRPTLSILDGVTEAMSLHGLEMKDNTDVARFGKLLPRWIADWGPAVVALDHVTKDREGRGRYAIGGVHKLNGVNGAAFTLENRTPFGIGRTGRSTLFVAKDRPGQLRRHGLPASEGMYWLADLVIESHEAGFVEAALTVPAQDAGPFRPTVLMRRVSEALEGAPGPLSKQDIEARVKGRAADIRTAIAALVDDGYVRVTTGKYNAKLHELIKPYGGAE